VRQPEQKRSTSHGYENEWEEAQGDQECERATRRREKNQCAQDKSEKDRLEEEGTGPEDGRETGHCAQNLRAQDGQETGAESCRAQSAGPQACGCGEAHGSCCS
jgi:hypothetical protein